MATKGTSQVTSATLWRDRQVLLHHLGKLSLELDRRRQEDRHLVKAEDLVWEESLASHALKHVREEGARRCRIISPDLGFNIHTFRIFMAEVPPGIEPGRYHAHGEAIKYYLSGRAVELVGDKEYEVKQGDFVFIPANTWHGTQNPFKESARVMAVQQMPGTYVQMLAAYAYRDEEHVERDMSVNSPDLPEMSSAELYRRWQALLHHLGKLDLEVEQRRKLDRHLARAEELVWEKSSGAQPTKADPGEGENYCRVVSPDLGFNIHNFRIFMAEMPPRTQRGRYHTHGEAVKYYLSGRAIEYVGDKEYQVKAGDFVFIPANAWHGTQNPYDEPTRVMAIQQTPGTYVQIAAPYIYREEDLAV